jgi:hypothetical protein
MTMNKIVSVKNVKDICKEFKDIKIFFIPFQK